MLRGYQGKQFRLYDKETEGYVDLTADEVQVGMFRIENGRGENDVVSAVQLDNGDMPHCRRFGFCVWQLQK